MFPEVVDTFRDNASIGYLFGSAGGLVYQISLHRDPALSRRRREIFPYLVLKVSASVARISVASRALRIDPTDARFAPRVHVNTAITRARRADPPRRKSHSPWSEFPSGVRVCHGSREFKRRPGARGK